MNEQTRKWQQSDMRDRWEMREWKKDDWDKLKETTKSWLIEIEMNKWIENNLAKFNDWEEWKDEKRLIERKKDWKKEKEMIDKINEWMNEQTLKENNNER